MKKFKNFLGILVTGMLVSVSCTDDFLDVEVLDTNREDSFYKTDRQMLSATAPLYGQSFFTVNDKFMYSLDLLAGNSVAFEADAPFKLASVPSDNRTLLEGWEGFYKGIADANQILKIIDQGLDPAISEEVASRVEGEARFVRAFAYYYLVRLWGDVPVIDSLVSDVSNPYPLYTASSIYRFIESEFKKAADLLPLESGDLRRVGKTAPWAYLAEMYLTLEDYEKSKEYAKLVIDSNLHTLQSNYQTQFINPTESINRETIYAWQWNAINGLWGIQNTNQAYLIDDDEVVGNEGAFGSVAPSPDLFFSFDKIKQENEEDLRRKWIIMEPDQRYPELRTDLAGGYVYEGEGATQMRYRKYVVGSNNEYPGTVFFMRTEMSTQLMRYADVLFIYAEAILGGMESTQDGEALNAVNQIRNRAGLSNKTLLTRMDILEERRIEFAIEAGKHWLDILRLDRGTANSILTAQDRGTVESFTPFITTPLKINPIEEENFLLPLPAVELSFIDTTKEPQEYTFE